MAGQINLMMNHGYKSLLHGEQGVYGQKNTDNVERLTSLGKMRSPGLEEVEKAKADGRWAKAYDSPKDMPLPDNFMKALSKNRKAKAFFETLNKTNKYAIGWRQKTAKKPETKEKRIKAIVAKGQLSHGHGIRKRRKRFSTATAFTCILGLMLWYGWFKHMS